MHNFLIIKLISSIVKIKLAISLLKQIALPYNANIKRNYISIQLTRNLIANSSFRLTNSKIK